jgi:hypothetical protein
MMASPDNSDKDFRDNEMYASRKVPEPDETHTPNFTFCV